MSSWPDKRKLTINEFAALSKDMVNILDEIALFHNSDAISQASRKILTGLTMGMSQKMLEMFIINTNKQWLLSNYKETVIEKSILEGTNVDVCILEKTPSKLTDILYNIVGDMVSVCLKYIYESREPEKNKDGKMVPQKSFMSAISIKSVKQNIL